MYFVEISAFTNKSTCDVDIAIFYQRNKIENKNLGAHINILGPDSQRKLTTIFILSFL